MIRACALDCFVGMVLFLLDHMCFQVCAFFEWDQWGGVPLLSMLWILYLLFTRHLGQGVCATLSILVFVSLLSIQGFWSLCLSYGAFIFLGEVYRSQALPDREVLHAVMIVCSLAFLLGMNVVKVSLHMVDSFAYIFQWRWAVQWALNGLLYMGVLHQVFNRLTHVVHPTFQLE